MIAKGLLATVVAAALFGSACAPPADARPLTDLFPGHDPRAQADAAVGTLTTVNVYVSDQGYDPASVDIGVGEQVQLVLRNIGYSEHHYQVVGLSAHDLFWLDQGAVDVHGDDVDAGGHGAAADAGGAHDHDHSVGALVPLGVSESTSGVQRRSDEVHAWAYAGKMDVIVFTPSTPGSYPVRDPLHPQLSGLVIVH